MPQHSNSFIPSLPLVPFYCDEVAKIYVRQGSVSCLLMNDDPQNSAKKVFLNAKKKEVSRYAGGLQAGF